MSATNTITVELNHLRFFAFHGVYTEELKTGNEFEVNAKVNFRTDKGLITHLHDTVNYARVYNIIDEIMKHHEPLLETVVMKIAEEIHKEFSTVGSVDIQLIKLHPPIINFTGNVAVRYHKEF
jgi:7,8-dihydroneopterin aldolase/epimerase/oxygenase